MIVKTWRVVLAMLALPIAGCQTTQGPGQNEAGLLTLTPSRACATDLPYFGHEQYPNGRTGLQYSPPRGGISTSNDGGWCAIRHAYYFRTRETTPELRVTKPPAHGEVVVGSVGGLLRIAYRPTRGYVGPDWFEVHIAGPDPDVIPVSVSVSG
jgi:hypothetical protein